MKKFLAAIMTATVALGLYWTGTVCLFRANAAEAPTHEHTVTYVDATSPSHKTEGYYAHYYCEACDVYFDAAGKQCTKNSLMILALGHLNAQKVEEKAATTCENGNIQYWYCATCDGKFAGIAPRAKEYTDEEVIIPATGHTLSYVEEVAATTEKEGVKAHWFCSACETYFSDAEGKTEVSKESLVIEQLPPIDEETSSGTLSDKESSSTGEQPSEIGGCVGSVSSVALISALLGGMAICVKKRKNSD